MKERLVIQLGHSVQSEVAWLPVDTQGRPLGSEQRGSLDAAAAMAARRAVTVFVPAERVTLVEAEVPGLSGRQLRQAVPYALEERVAGDVEDLHFALAPTQANDRVPVAVVERATMDTWLTALRDVGITPEAMVPDCLGLPFTPGSVSVATGPTRAFARTGEFSGFAGEPGFVDQLIGPSPRRDGVSADRALPVLAGRAERPVINLLQGRYAPRRSHADRLGRWRLPAGLATALILVIVVSWALEYRAIAAEHRNLQARISTLFSAAIPDEPMVDARAQIQRRLGSHGTSELLPMLAVIADALADQQGVEISGLSYRPGALDLTVSARQADQVDTLRDRIASAGRFGATIESASSRGERVEGRLVVKGAGR